MKVLSRKFHAVLDVLLVALLLTGPWLFVQGAKGIESLAMLGAGFGLLAYSLMTKYELGICRAMNFKSHLAIDLLSGVFLLASPWLLDFGDRSYWPHWIIGGLLIVSALVTRNESIPIPQQEKTFTF